jgi:hypothetical protein
LIACTKSRFIAGYASFYYLLKGLDMQMNMNRSIKLLFASFLLFPLFSIAQVNTVEYGKNRVQYKKLKWKFYQSPNFNSYVSQGGTDMGKFVAQLAEQELPSIETDMEYSLQRRANIVVYNSFDEYRQSNIGLGIDWQQAGGLTKLVNNKIVVYFDGNHEHLKYQIREGIARVILDNLLFGDDIGEIASNQALLDLPKWLTDGYVSYISRPWSTERDDELKSSILAGDYKSFYHFAFDKPLLAGHAFWYFIAEKYKKENVTYFLYLARVYKNLNNASMKITKKKFKALLAEFMEYEQDKYYKDIARRRNAPKGSVAATEDVSKIDMYRFTMNPNPKSKAYAYIEFHKGIYSVKLNENYYDATTLLTKGIKTYQGDINPNYPILAWDGKGTRLLVIYPDQGKIKMFVYDFVAKYKRAKQVIEGFDQILDASYMLDANTVIFSAVKNGHSDIFIYKIEENKAEQVTNDVYDDLNPTFVSFPNRSGIIFSSNRPSSDAPNNDTILPSKYKFNIFMVDILNKSAIKQTTMLTNMKYGNATLPMQYNTNHFTFVSDETGIANRYAGFFSTQRTGLDTLYYIGDELLRNPAPKELDSALLAWRKQEPDSISYFQVYKDSTYSFPITNYASSLLETRIAGNNGNVSEVRREGDYKFVYKLKVDDNTLARRNINPKRTSYMERVVSGEKIKDGKAIIYKNGKPVPNTDTAKTEKKKVFQTEFDNDKPDSSATAAEDDKPESRPSDLSKMKLFNYRLKFSTDYLVSGITNNILINRYQPYQGGQGPVQLNNGSDVNWSFRVGVSDLMEDVKFIGGYRFGGNIKDKDAFISFQNYRKKIDWGLTYFRSTVSDYQGYFKGDVVGIPVEYYNNKLITNLYQFNISYPFDETKRMQLTAAYRTDRGIIKPNLIDGTPDPLALDYPDSITKYILTRAEYVYDNTINPAQNIWNGLRWKIYMDVNMPMSEGVSKGANFNLGVDARHYWKIYRNFIWATRAAADFSWGEQKMIYYLGGVDGWVGPKFNNRIKPAADQTYAFQSLAMNMRGFNQNVANGNNAVVLNSELRFPVFATLLNKPINNAFLRNFQLIQFIDLGTAWNGKFNGIERPSTIYTDDSNPNNPLSVRIKAGGIGPFVGGYGFGARSTLLGYFMKLDCAWEMKGVFRGKPILYFALGLDF